MTRLEHFESDNIFIKAIVQSGGCYPSDFPIKTTAEGIEVITFVKTQIFYFFIQKLVPSKLHPRDKKYVQFPV